ncbi:MAG: family 10 glycosylhydrolase [Victivallales bacterium]|nr:family 10 glycosylhydrolase [Victivallales bacterium]
MKTIIIKTLLLSFLLCIFAESQQLDLRLAGANANPCGPAALPQLLRYGESTGLAFSATFLNDSYQRAYWDLPINENLTHCAGVKLRVFCIKPELIRQFNVYIRTGSVWQSAIFAPSSEKSWQEIFIPKAQFHPETTAGSWQKASVLRLAFWKGATGQTVLHLASLEFVRPNVPVAIIRSGFSGKEMQEAYKYADHLSNALTRHGVLPAVIEQEDTTYLNLRPYSFVYLPHPAAANPNQLANLASFIRRGGKAAVFHALPPILQQAMGFPTGKYTSTKDLATVKFLPYTLPYTRNYRLSAESFIKVDSVLPPQKTVAVWENTHGNMTNWPAIIESSAGFWVTHAFLNKDPDNTPATMAAFAAKHIPTLRQSAAFTRYEYARKAYNDSVASKADKAIAKRTLDSARVSYQNAQYETTIQMANDCINALTAIGITPVSANAYELRALWCNHEIGLRGESMAATARRIKEADFNAFFLYSGSSILANYPSRVTPLTNSSNLISPCLDNCRPLGIQTHAWINCLSLEDASRNPHQQHVLKQWCAQGRLQMDSDLNTLPWLCPSQIQNRQHLARLISEIAVNYQLDGIHLDFLRYPKSAACLCPLCHKAFEIYLGRQTTWPQAVMAGGGDHARWIVFRQRILSTLVQELAAAARQARPGIQISAAVFPDLASAKNAVGQDWQNWLANGNLNFVCPMNYQSSAAAFLSDVRRQKQEVGDALHRLVPGIGVSVHNLTLNQVRQQIYSARQEQTAGFALFSLNSREANDILPNLFH